METLKRPLNY